MVWFDVVRTIHGAIHRIKDKRTQRGIEGISRDWGLFSIAGGLVCSGREWDWEGIRMWSG